MQINKAFPHQGPHPDLKHAVVGGREGTRGWVILLDKYD